MGASESSMLAVEERAACFKRGPELTTELYRSEMKYRLFSTELFNSVVLLPHCSLALRRHTKGEELPGLLTVVPDCLTYRTCLYRLGHNILLQSFLNLYIITTAIPNLSQSPGPLTCPSTFCRTCPLTCLSLFLIW